MPFTPSHIAAVLPFVRTPLAPAALALGSMAPDIPYFLPIGIPRSVSHSLPGVPTVDLLVGLVAFVLWLLVLRAPVLDYAPGWVRERMDVRVKWRVRGSATSWLLVIAALELGILTHLLLDLFTHEGGGLDLIAPWSGDHVGTFSIANIIHAVVSFVAGGIVALWAWRWLRRTPRQQRATKLGQRERVLTWVVLLLILAIVGLAWWIAGIASGLNPLDPKLLGKSFFIAVAVSGGVACVIAVAWRLRGDRVHRTATTVP